MSNFDQTPTGKEYRLVLGFGGRGLSMPLRNQFWQYAREAIISAADAKTDEEKHVLLDLARIWTQAALVVRRSPIIDPWPSQMPDSVLRQRDQLKRKSSRDTTRPLPSVQGTLAPPRNDRRSGQSA
jgi:hypothetical protein